MIKSFWIGLMFLGLTIQPAAASWPFGPNIGGAQPAKVKKTSVVVFSLRGSYSESSVEQALFRTTKTLQSIFDKIQKAQKDPKVHAVLFRFGGLALTMGQAKSVQKAIRRLSKSGKKTYALLESATLIDYVTALGCQKIFMVPVGTLFIPGLRAEMLYYKKLLDRLGLEGDFVAAGDFKTAPEPFLKEEMSEAQKKQMTSLIDDLYQQIVLEIATERKIKAEAVKKVIDLALISPKQALNFKIIDGIFYLQGLKQSLRKSFAGSPVSFLTNYAKKKAKKPQSIWSLFSLLMGSKSKKAQNNKPKIAVVYAKGQILYGKSSGGVLGNDEGIWSHNFLNMLKKVEKLKNLRAIVLRVDSPGGSALASDLIWRKLEQIKKKVPLYVSMGRVAASGGYYIAMGADVLFAESSTITGSIGVFAGKIVMRKTMGLIGIRVHHVSRGKNAGIFSSYSRFTESERKVLKTMIQKTYDVFVSKAAKGRKMDKKKLLALAGGRVWTGKQAKASGLIDRLGDLGDAIELAKKRTGLKVIPEIVRFPREKSLFDWFQGLSGGASMQQAYWKRLAVVLGISLSSIQQVPRILLPLLKPLPMNQRVMMWSPIPTVKVH